MRHGDVGQKRLGHGSAAVALLAAIVCIVATPSRARADHDITNDWVVTLNVQPGSLVIGCTWAFQQTGGTFTANGSCGSSATGGLQGTIDVVTGAVAGTGGVMNLEGPLVSFDFTGSVAPSGSTISTTLGGSVTGTMTASLCQNGNLDPGEDCDEGFTPDGCCTSSCTLKPDGTSCSTTIGCQIAPTCSAGACVGAPRMAGTSCEADGNRCTDDVCDGAGSCTVGACSPCCGGPSCTPAPRWFACQRPTDARSLIDIRATPLGAKDRIVWTVPHLEATAIDDLPDPQTTPYGVCFYVLDANDEFSVLQYDALAPVAQGCGRARCWTTRPKGVAYNGGPLKPGGVASLRVSAGAEGKARLSFVGKGPELGLYQPFGLYVPGGELLVELHAGDSCWSAYYVNDGVKPSIRTSTRYRMKGGQ